MNNSLIILINGSNHSGKSKLGHLLGSHPNAMHNYSTLSYNEYFSEKNFKIKKDKIKKLKKDFKRINYLCSGGIEKNGKKWLKEDKIRHLNFHSVYKNLINKINEDLTIEKFYKHWSDALIKGRTKKSKILFVIFEVENLISTKVIDHLCKKTNNIKIINIYRDLYDQILSLKLNIIFRGANIKNFHGALAGRMNLFKLWLSEIILQHKFLFLNYKNILSIKLDNLKPINIYLATKIERFIFKKKRENLVMFLINNSKNENYKNEYLSYKRHTQSYLTYKNQRHLKIKNLIKKKNINDFTFEFENKFYELLRDRYDFHSNKNYELDLWFFLKICFFSVIFGFKDLRDNKPLIKSLTLRLNSLMIVLYTILLINKKKG